MHTICRLCSHVLKLNEWENILVYNDCNWQLSLKLVFHFCIFRFLFVSFSLVQLFPFLFFSSLFLSICIFSIILKCNIAFYRHNTGKFITAELTNYLSTIGVTVLTFILKYVDIILRERTAIRVLATVCSKRVKLQEKTRLIEVLLLKIANFPFYKYL